MSWILRGFEFPENEKKSILLLASALAISQLARLVAGRVAVLWIILLLTVVTVGAVHTIAQVRSHCSSPLLLELPV